jgi:hypothetical protein
MLHSFILISLIFKSFHHAIQSSQVILSIKRIATWGHVEELLCRLKGVSEVLKYRSNYVRSPAPRSWKWTTECWNVDAASTGDSATTSTIPEHVSAEFKPNCKILFV